ncbi:DUF6281 family protein [Streptomyces sp. NPDC048594]|uniref:DUF6281 family protein n=1 Tax=Streptomyces sp. NPDC048594 TaxID=3365575 RepID=UPI00371B30D1
MRRQRRPYGVSPARTRQTFPVRALGTAEFPSCDDTPVHDADAAKLEPVTAYAVDGLNPRTTIAIRYPSDEFMLLVVQPDGSLPPEVKAPTPA